MSHSKSKIKIKYSEESKEISKTYKNKLLKRV